ncbi:hypothetical protein ACB098_12G099600 [Castanea mollissima]
MTGHMIGLDLSCSWLYGTIHSNSTLFVLHHLKRLNLARNDFNHSLLPSEFGQFKSLTHLNLTYSSFFGQIPYEISQLSSLVSLDLSENHFFSGELPDSIGNLNFSSSISASLGNLTQLTYLKLSSNSFTGSIPKSLGNFGQLRFLDLSNNSFTESISVSLENLTQIIFLDLSTNIISGLLTSSLFNMPKVSRLHLHENQLGGPLPNHVSGLLDLTALLLDSNFLNGMFTLPSLVELIIFGNQFIGEIGEFKSNSLQILVMGDNKLHAHIPRSISRLVKLTYLDLSLNNLSIMLGSEMFSKLINLQDLDFSYNHVSINITNNVIDFMPMLQSLSLHSCNISEFPIFLRMTPNLLILDLSNNKISGHVPKWLGDVALDSLSFLNLSHNFLTRINEIPWKNVIFVDLHDNLLQGPFPTLHLSHNKFSGMIPKCLMDFSVSLSVLDLRMNKLHGTIPTSFSKRNKLRNLNLNGNQLEGPLPQSLVNCRELKILDVGNNKINDTFPYWLEILPNLQVFVIRSNRFHGHIGKPTTKSPFPSFGLLPKKYFKYLKATMNAYQGEVGLKYMGEAYYQDSLMVTMKGTYIELVRILIVFTTIDLSNNSFEGEMPKIIGKLKSLKGLNFSHNNLTGYIPQSLGNLTNLKWLDLSSNKLIGEIPISLVNLTSLAVLNLSHNQLTGSVPLGNQFNTFNNDSYIGNLGLCGFPLSRTCNNHEAMQPPGPPPSTLQHKDNLQLKHILGLKNGYGWKAVSIGYGCGVIFGMFMGYLLLKIGRPRWLWINGGTARSNKRF